MRPTYPINVPGTHKKFQKFTIIYFFFLIIMDILHCRSYYYFHISFYFIYMELFKFTNIFLKIILYNI